MYDKIDIIQLKHILLTVQTADDPAFFLQLFIKNSREFMNFASHSIENSKIGPAELSNFRKNSSMLIKVCASLNNFYLRMHGEAYHNLQQLHVFLISEQNRLIKQMKDVINKSFLPTLQTRFTLLASPPSISLPKSTSSSSSSSALSFT